jgi:hypothetical protein
MSHILLDEVGALYPRDSKSISEPRNIYMATQSIEAMSLDSEVCNLLRGYEGVTLFKGSK